MLISQNPSKNLAEADLKYCDYKVTESTNKLIISNFLTVRKTIKKSVSNLTAKYEIEILQAML